MAKKFKVGDRVVVKDTYSIPSHRGLVGTVKRVEQLASPQWVGDLISVEFDEPIKYGWDCHGYTKIGFGWSIRERHLKLYKPEKIIIRREGNNVIAHCTHVNKRAEAKCSPEDEFDFAVGAKLAFERLAKELGWVEEPKPPLYNGKVVCIDNSFNRKAYTVGKIYEFKDGQFKDDMDYIIPTTPCTSFEDWSRCTVSKFIEVVE